MEINKVWVSTLLGEWLDCHQHTIILSLNNAFKL